MRFLTAVSMVKPEILLEATERVFAMVCAQLVYVYRSARLTQQYRSGLMKETKRAEL